MPRSNGAISAVLVRDFGPGGGAIRGKVFHIDAKRDWRDNSSHLLGSKRRFRLKEQKHAAKKWIWCGFDDGIGDCSATRSLVSTLPSSHWRRQIREL
jgi:hypothetical protein